jgi:hypothetical protein
VLVYFNVLFHHLPQKVEFIIKQLSHDSMAEILKYELSEI